MINCLECDRDDITLSCQDPRTPPLSLDICLCNSCGENAYRDRVQEIFDDMNDELGYEDSARIWREVLT